MSRPAHGVPAAATSLFAAGPMAVPAAGPMAVPAAGVQRRVVRP